MAWETLTWPPLSSAMLTSKGAPITDTKVTVISNVIDSVNNRRINAAPWSSSSFSARTSTGITREVSTAPSTISVTMLGNVFATLNADATAGPMVAPMAMLRRKPVIRLIRVAMAMDPVERTTSLSDCVSSASPAEPRGPLGPPGRAGVPLRGRDGGGVAVPTPPRAPPAAPTAARGETLVGAAAARFARADSAAPPAERAGSLTAELFTVVGGDAPPVAGRRSADARCRSAPPTPRASVPAV